jgi:hypothetical protein
MPEKARTTSFPRRREPKASAFLLNALGPRLRGDDDLFPGMTVYFAMPTAFIVAPSSASDFAMNLPNSSGPA